MGGKRTSACVRNTVLRLALCLHEKAMAAALNRERSRGEASPGDLVGQHPARVACRLLE
jgi:hypothetical protein